MGRVASTPRASALWTALLVAATVTAVAAAAAAAAGCGGGGCGCHHRHARMAEAAKPLPHTCAQGGPAGAPGRRATRGSAAAGPDPLMDAGEVGTVGGAAAHDLDAPASGGGSIPESKRQDLSMAGNEPGVRCRCARTDDGGWPP